MTVRLQAAMFKESFGTRMRQTLFWLRDGRGIQGKARLLCCWLSPHWGGHQPKAPIPILTRFDGSRPIHVRPNSTDARVLRRVFGRRCYALPPSWTGPFESVVDLGANGGIGTLFFALRYPAARVVAVEPDANSFACLRANVEGMPRVETRQVCMADREGMVRFDEEGPSDGHRMTDDGGVEIPAETLVGLLDRAGLERVSLLKMDIEGAEELVLRSVDEWLPRVDWAIIEFHFRDANLVRAREKILAHDRVLLCRVPSEDRWRVIDAAAAERIPRILETLDVVIAPAAVADQVGYPALR